MRPLYGFLIGILFVGSCDDNGKNIESDNGNTVPIDSLPPSGYRPIDINRWWLMLTPNGQWAYDRNDMNNDGMENGARFPSSSSNYAIYTGGLMVGAVSGGMARVSAINYSSEFTAGHIMNTEPAPFGALHASDPSRSPTFIIDPVSAATTKDWRYWPKDQGAPWDSISDRPLLVSDQDSWAIFHDLYADSLGSQLGMDPALGLELIRRTYAYKFGLGSDIVFVHYRITNKTIESYSNAFVSWWLDHNLGPEIYNDRVATDSTLNMVYTYNDTPDQTSTGKQYAIGHRLLYFTGMGTGTRLHSSNAYVNGTDPDTDLKMYYVMQGLRQDGTPYDSTFVGNGSGRLIYPGDPVTGTGTLCPSGRNGCLMANVGPFTLESGKSYDIIFAVIGGEADDRLSAITDLRSAATDAANIFQALILPDLNLK